MTFWPLTNSDLPTNQTFHQFHDLYTELDLHRIMSGFHGAFATGVASHQGTLTLPDTWFRPPFWDLLMLQLLRPNSSNLPCLCSTFHLEYPLVLSRFYLTNFNWDLDLWLFYLKMYKYLPFASMYEIWKLNDDNYSSYCVCPKMLTMFSCDLDLWPFDPKMYTYRPPAIVHLCMRYEICMLKTTQLIVSEPKCWQSSVVTLTFDLLTPKCIGILLSPSCIYVWNMKSVRWKRLKVSCQNQSVDRQTDGQTDGRTDRQTDKTDSYRIYIWLNNEISYILCNYQLAFVPMGIHFLVNDFNNKIYLN